jgi:Coenzyme PQQ synthesis protein D (PqqD)
MELENRLVRGEKILAKAGPDSDTVILLNPEDGQYYTLEGVGARIWDLCDGKRSVSDVISAISEEYDAPPATVQADVIELLGDLEKEGLILADDGTTGRDEALQQPR